MILSLDFKQLMQKAKPLAEKMVSNGLHSRFGLSYYKRVEKALLGCVGELAFEEYLKQKSINYSLDNSDFTQTNSDEYDFLINGKKIDVKVAKKSTGRRPTDGWTYGYPNEQNPSSKDFVVVGWVDFTNEEIGFYGWITGSQISKYTVVTQNSFAGYSYLTPNHEFRWGDMNKNFDQLFQKINV